MAVAAVPVADNIMPKKEAVLLYYRYGVVSKYQALQTPMPNPAN